MGSWQQLAALALALCAVSGGDSLPACNFPPSLWCSSWEIAVACQVEKHCPNLHRRPPAAPPVSVSLYYESLCPACRMFLVTQLFPTWLMLNDITNITLVPYGNAQTCLMYHLKDVQQYFPVIFCMESGPAVSANLEACLQIYAPSAQLADIQACVKGDLGNKLMHHNAQLTDALDPPHNYVPWIVINEKHTQALQDQAQKALFMLVCKMYTGEKPDACNQGEAESKTSSLSLN
uniref:Gamma-interferon-inducible lysosomal thiol reductase n=1 Tax=Pelusios castaneus TaxID=367368 RepID=A0A8C8S5M7_9SAUR